MNVLVTGAGGFVGRALIRRLMLSPNIKLKCVSSHPSAPGQPFYYQVKDFQASKSWSNLLQDIDVVVHLVGLSESNDNCSGLAEKKLFKINCDYTTFLAKRAKSHGVKRFIYISTVKVNGETTKEGEYFDADDVPNPIGPYANSKHCAEKMLTDICNNSSMEYVIIRPVLIYSQELSGNVQRLSKFIKHNVPLPLSSIKNMRSLVHIDNLNDFIELCLNHPRAKNQIFLISDGNDLSIGDIIQMIAKSQGRSPRLFPLPPHILKLMLKLIGMGHLVDKLLSSLQVNISKNEEMLGWSPTKTHKSLFD